MSSSSSGAADPAVSADDGAESQYRAATVVVCAVVLPVLATVAVALRFYVRAKLLRAVKAEDWLILVAMIFSIISAAFVIMESRAGLGRHAAELSASEALDFMKASYINTLFYNLSLCFTKLSILLLYLRVLTLDYIRKVTWVAIGIVGTYNAWALGMYLSMCIPLAKMWDVSIQDGYCHPWSVWWALTYLHISTDFLIFIIPIPVVVTMTIPMRQKVGLLIVFTMGLFVCLISVIRTVWLNQLLYAADNTWYLVTIANWSTAELNAAVVCACMPTLRPVLTKVFGPLADRVFPEQQHSLDTTGGQPRTIGSVPMNKFRFGRGAKGQGTAKPDHLDISCEAGTDSTDVEAQGSVYHPKDRDSDAELVAGGDDGVAKPSPGMQGPPKARTRWS